MTDLLDRYLAAVGRQLPSAQRADILAELRDELLTTIELKEESAGRPITREELEAVLLEAGNPLVVAGRYRKVQHVVGPDTFPLWWFAVKMALSVLAGIYLVVAVIKIGFMGGGGPDVEVGDFLHSSVFAVGLITLGAVAIEHLNLQGYVYRWRPRQLPPAGVKGKSPFERVVEIGMAVVFVLWWTGALHFPNQVGPVTVDLAPVFAVWFWPVLAYSALDIGVNLLGLLKPGLIQLNAALSVARGGVAVIVAAGILQAGRWLVVRSDELPAAALAEAQTHFDLGMKLGLVVTLAGLAIAMVLDAVKLWRLVQDARAPLRTAAG